MINSKLSSFLCTIFKRCGGIVKVLLKLEHPESSMTNTFESTDYFFLPLILESHNSTLLKIPSR